MEKVEGAFTPADRIGQLTMRNLDIAGHPRQARHLHHDRAAGHGRRLRHSADRQGRLKRFSPGPARHPRQRGCRAAPRRSWTSARGRERTAHRRPAATAACVIERISVAWSPRGKSVRPIEPWNSTSPTRAMPTCALAKTTCPGVWPGQWRTSKLCLPTVTVSPSSSQRSGVKRARQRRRTCVLARRAGRSRRHRRGAGLRSARRRAPPLPRRHRNGRCGRA